MGASTAIFLVSARDALAEDAAAPTEILVVHGTQEAGKGSIDPKIGNVAQLSKPPFSAYNTYKFIDRKVMQVEKGKSSSYALPNGRTLVVNVEPQPGGKLFRVVASIAKPEGGNVLKALEVTAPANETFFVAGQNWNGGTLVVGITVKK
jgi:hypothetical protein